MAQMSSSSKIDLMPFSKQKRDNATYEKSQSFGACSVEAGVLL